MSEDLIERVLEAARWAPSPHGRQPWRFAVLRSEETKERLAGAMGEEWRANLEMDGQSVEIVEKRLEGSRRRLLRRLYWCSDLSSTSKTSMPTPMRSARAVRQRWPSSHWAPQPRTRYSRPTTRASTRAGCVPPLLPREGSRGAGSRSEPRSARAAHAGIRRR